MAAVGFSEMLVITCYTTRCHSPEDHNAFRGSTLICILTGNMGNIKNVVFWDVALCRSWVNRRFERMYRLHLQGGFFYCSPLAEFSTLKLEATRSSETSVNPGSTQHHIPEDDIRHSHRCENLRSYMGNIIQGYILIQAQ
jgi:hypothetical protein